MTRVEQDLSSYKIANITAYEADHFMFANTLLSQCSYVATYNKIKISAQDFKFQKFRLNFKISNLISEDSYTKRDQPLKWLFAMELCDFASQICVHSVFVSSKQFKTWKQFSYS